MTKQELLARIEAWHAWAEHESGIDSQDDEALAQIRALLAAEPRACICTKLGDNCGTIAVNNSCRIHGPGLAMPPRGTWPGEPTGLCSKHQNPTDPDCGICFPQRTT